MRRELPRIRAAGADLYVVGSGTPDMARDFRATHAPGIGIFVDPELASYRAAGLRRSVAGSVGPGAAIRALRALARGHLPGRRQGDPWQLGGVLVIAPPGVVLFRHADRNSGDHAPVEAVLAALRR